MTYKTATTTRAGDLRQYLKAVVQYNREQRAKNENTSKVVRSLMSR